MKKANKNDRPPQGGDNADDLTGKQQAFINAYLSNGFNATDAARQAGYEGNDNVLGVTGYANLRNPKIAAVVLGRLNEAAMSANEVLAILSMQARGSLADVLTENGEFDLHEAKKRGTDRLLKKLKIRRTIRRRRDDEEIEDITHEYEIHDPQAAAVHVGKFHKLFTDKVEHGNPDGSPLLQPVADALTKVYGANAANK
jgi:polyhydroxyalkanoate synthesis regulator phasin